MHALILSLIISVTPPGSDPRKALEAQVAAWNAGDLAGFLSYYDDSKDTVFVSGANVEKGLDAIRTRYQKRYGSKEKMGTLRFEELTVLSQTSDTAVVSGAWRVVRADGQKASGRFTLLLKKRPAGWRIVYDHTS